MKQLFKQITQYQRNIQQIRRQNIANYFDIKQLLTQAEKTQQSLKMLIWKKDKDKQEARIRQHVLQHKISRHPDRSVIQLDNHIHHQHKQQRQLPKHQIKQKPKQLKQQRQIKITDNSNKHKDKSDQFYQKFITPNIKLALTITPIHLYPIYLQSPTSSNTSSTTTLIPTSTQLSLHIYHIDKHSHTNSFSYNMNTNLNINKYFQYSASTIKIYGMEIVHEITMGNYQMMKELVKENEIGVYLETEGKVVVGQWQTSIQGIIDIIAQEQGKQRDQSKWNQIITKQNIKLDKNKYIKFNIIGTTQQLFTLQCKITLQKSVISPQMIQLWQKMHTKKVLINESTRSRSPSPTLHRLTATSLIKTKKDKIRRIMVAHDRPVKFVIHKKIDENQYQYQQKQKFDKNYTILQSRNINNVNGIQIIQNMGQIGMVLHFKCVEIQRQGYIQVKVGDVLYKIQVVYLKIFTKLTLQQSKVLFKNSEDCYKHNAMITLCQNICIRPSPYINVIQSKAIYKVHKKQMINYFIPIVHKNNKISNNKDKHNGIKQKNNNQNNNVSEEIFDKKSITVYPGVLKSVENGEKGIAVWFSLDMQQLRKKQQTYVVISVKRKTAQPLLPPKTQQNRIKKQPSIPSLLTTILQQNVPRNTSSIIHQLHILKYQFFPKPLPQINLTLDITTPGIYTLPLPDGLIVKQNWYTVTSNNQNLLRVCRWKFIEEARNISKIQVQLMRLVKIKEKVCIIVQNVSKNIVCCIELELVQKQYWKHYDNLYPSSTNSL